MNKITFLLLLELLSIQVGAITSEKNLKITKTPGFQILFCDPCSDGAGGEKNWFVELGAGASPFQYQFTDPHRGVGIADDFAFSPIKRLNPYAYGRVGYRFIFLQYDFAMHSICNDRVINHSVLVGPRFKLGDWGHILLPIGVGKAHGKVLGKKWLWRAQPTFQLKILKWLNLDIAYDWYMDTSDQYYDDTIRLYKSRNTRFDINSLLRFGLTFDI